MDQGLMDRIEAQSTWEPNSGCRLWLGGTARGHGLIKSEGKMLYVHRLMWEHEQGAIPPTMFVLHKCGIGICFNVDHLALGTRLDNAADRRRHGGYRPLYGAGRTVPEERRVFITPHKRDAKVMDAPLDQTEARRLFDYDAATGVLRWKHRPDRAHEWNTRFAGKEAGAILPNGYRYVKVAGALHLAHRVIWLWMTGEWPERQVDHANRKRADNRWGNLRAATNQENQLNTGLRSTNRSGVKGVSFDKAKGLWIAMITVAGKQRFLGYGRTIEEAAAIRREAELARDLPTEGTC